MKNNVTMKDIASRLGVSSVTISKALNDKEGVGEELREKIKAVAEEMGYRYNTVAKAMKEGTTYNIGVMIPERFTSISQSSFYLDVYQHISRALEEYGYYGILNILSSDDEDQLHLPKLYHENKVDGFVFLGQINKEYIKTIQIMDLPKVFLDFYDEQTDIDAIITDNFMGAYEITNYLINKGHKNIAFVGNVYSTSSIQDRFLGYYKSLLEHKMELVSDYIIKDRDERGKYIEMTIPEHMPSAFVCNCDQIAHNLILKLKSQGIRVPEDCSVVGFDNDIYATISDPPLTTIAVDVEEMAKTSARFIVEKIKDSHKRFGRVSIKGNIVYRDSVKEI
ncbi:substrate-binding domain-containing protein [Robertmurraya sp. GLU-23]